MAEITDPAADLQRLPPPSGEISAGQVGVIARVAP
jgi:hypothetical protein